MNEPKPIVAMSVAEQSGCSYPEPFASRMGNGTWRALGDAFDLDQFGVSLETLSPGAQSSIKHWHTLSDELVYMIEGELVLWVNDRRFVMAPGMCVGFKAGRRTAHHLINESDRVARFIVVGTRVPGDNAFYPDDDVVWFATPSGRVMVHKDGTPYSSNESGGQ